MNAPTYIRKDLSAGAVAYSPWTQDRGVASVLDKEFEGGAAHVAIHRRRYSVMPRINPNGCGSSRTAPWWSAALLIAALMQIIQRGFMRRRLQSNRAIGG